MVEQGAALLRYHRLFRVLGRTMMPVRLGVEQLGVTHLLAAMVGGKPRRGTDQKRPLASGRHAGDAPRERHERELSGIVDVRLADPETAQRTPDERKMLLEREREPACVGG